MWLPMRDQKNKKVGKFVLEKCELNLGNQIGNYFLKIPD